MGSGEGINRDKKRNYREMKQNDHYWHVTFRAQQEKRKGTEWLPCSFTFCQHLEVFAGPLLSLFNLRRGTSSSVCEDTPSRSSEKGFFLVHARQTIDKNLGISAGMMVLPSLLLLGFDGVPLEGFFSLLTTSGITCTL